MSDHYPYPEVRRNDTERRLSRETEAAYGALEYQQIVFCRGEHLTPEPVKFGRAFDAPPFFTYSGIVRQARVVSFTQVGDDEDPPFTGYMISHLTIGVAEWVRDEQGMYIGAFLWYKLSVKTEDFGQEPCE
jgi:hypothetical protein